MITLLFDIDGTLLRLRPGVSRQFVFAAFQAATSHAVPQDLEISFAGMTDQGIFRTLASHVVPTIDQSSLSELWPEYHKRVGEEFGQLQPEDVIVFDGIQPLLDDLAADERNKLALLTGNTQHNAFAKLRAAGLESYFSAGAFGEHSHDRNDLPPIAFSTTGGTAKSSMIIGDTPADIACAHAHDVPVVAVATGPYSTSELASHKPDYCLPTLTASNYFLRIVEEQHERQVDYSH